LVLAILCIEPRPASDGEVVRTVRSLHDAEVDRVRAGAQSARGPHPRRRARDPQFPASTLPVAARHDAQRDARSAHPARTCIAVPSPPWLTRTSNPCERLLRDAAASPGPGDGRKSTFHPPGPDLENRPSRPAHRRRREGLVISSAPSSQ